MSISEFIKDLDKEDSKLKGFFTDSNNLIISLKKLDNLIGMGKVKIQIIQQIKSFICAKTMGVDKDIDRKHCLLLGDPGTGKTTVGKILCEIWIAIGFIGEGGSFNKKVNTFNKIQDELIRSNRIKIRDLETKIKMCSSHIGKVKRVDDVNKRIINNLIRIKDNSPDKEIIDRTISELSSINKIVKQTDEIIKKIITQKNPIFEGFGLEPPDDSISSKRENDLPFYIYKRHDVISKYFGGTAHMVNKAMSDAIGGVAFFDEAYNLCNNSGSFDDTYGREALTSINEFMEEHSDKLIVVFAGYKKEIYNNLFKTQSGLQSRFTNIFEIDPYTPEELVRIYIQRLSYKNLYVKPSLELLQIIKDNYHIFTFQGRDMDKLAIYTKRVNSENAYDLFISGRTVSNVITDFNIIKRAVDLYKENMIDISNINNNNNDNFRRLFENLNTN
jgi:adenylate kinase family enzyme